MAVATKNAMSKIYDRYIELKNKDSDKIYLFLCGNFYIALDSDAIILNELFGMKLTKFSNLWDKCGFPKNSIEKYINISIRCYCSFETGGRILCHLLSRWGVFTRG